MSAAMTKSAGRQFFAHPQALVDSEEIGERTRVWAFAHVMAGALVGSDCNLGEHAFVETGARIGNHVTVKNGVSVWAGITVEDHVFLGPHCVLTNDPNPRAYIRKTADELVPTLIRANATIGANATILCGVTIGRYAFIGAGTVVLRSVPDYGLMVGNPARQIGWMCACAHQLPFPAQTGAGANCQCSHCGRSFITEAGEVREK
jgi:UDP-2-acetamido-3-amino-2,3-dideoxy-glucuronate N-acetyltransferase